MPKKKLKNNESKPLYEKRILGIAQQLRNDSGLTGTLSEVVLANSRLKAGRAKSETALVKEKYKKDRLKRLVESLLERLSRKYGIAQETIEAFSLLLSSLILPPIVKNGYEGKLKILQKMNAVKLVTEKTNEDGVLATQIINSLTKPTPSDLSFQISTWGLNEP